MNNFHLKNIIIFILCGSSYCAPFIFSQNYTLSNWMVEDGLSSNDVKELLQDEEGFIW